MTTAQPNDQFLVNRDGVSYKVTNANLMAEIKNDDLMLINRDDVSYKITGLEVKQSVTDPLTLSVTITPETPIEGTVAKANTSISGGKEPLTIDSYQWSTSDSVDPNDNKQTITDATESTYTPVAADVDKFLSCTVTGSDSYGSTVTTVGTSVTAVESGVELATPIIIAPPDGAGLNSGIVEYTPSTSDITNINVSGIGDGKWSYKGTQGGSGTTPNSDRVNINSMAYAVTCDPSGNNEYYVVYAAGSGGSYCRSSNNGASWTALEMMDAYPGVYGNLMYGGKFFVWDNGSSTYGINSGDCRFVIMYGNQLAYTSPIETSYNSNLILDTSKSYTSPSTTCLQAAARKLYLFDTGAVYEVNSNMTTSTVSAPNYPSFGGGYSIGIVQSVNDRFIILASSSQLAISNDPTNPVTGGFSDLISYGDATNEEPFVNLWGYTNQPDRIFAITSTGRIYYSDDLCKTWTDSEVTLTTTNEYGSLATNPITTNGNFGYALNGSPVTVAMFSDWGTRKYSTDGLNWTEVEVNSGAAPGTYNNTFGYTSFLTNNRKNGSTSNTEADMYGLSYQKIDGTNTSVPNSFYLWEGFQQTAITLTDSTVLDDADDTVVKDTTVSQVFKPGDSVYQDTDSNITGQVYSVDDSENSISLINTVGTWAIGSPTKNKVVNTVTAKKINSGSFQPMTDTILSAVDSGFDGASGWEKTTGATYMGGRDEAFYWNSSGTKKWFTVGTQVIDPDGNVLCNSYQSIGAEADAASMNFSCSYSSEGYNLQGCDSLPYNSSWIACGSSGTQNLNGSTLRLVYGSGSSINNFNAAVLTWPSNSVYDASYVDNTRFMDCLGPTLQGSTPSGTCIAVGYAGGSGGAGGTAGIVGNIVYSHNGGSQWYTADPTNMSNASLYYVSQPGFMYDYVVTYNNWSGSSYIFATGNYASDDDYSSRDNLANSKSNIVYTQSDSNCGKNWYVPNIPAEDRQALAFSRVFGADFIGTSNDGQYIVTYAVDSTNLEANGMETVYQYRMRVDAGSPQYATWEKRKATFATGFDGRTLGPWGYTYQIPTSATEYYFVHRGRGAQVGYWAAFDPDGLIFEYVWPEKFTYEYAPQIGNDNTMRVFPALGYSNRVNNQLVANDVFIMGSYNGNCPFVYSTSGLGKDVSAKTTITCGSDKVFNSETDDEVNDTTISQVFTAGETVHGELSSTATSAACSQVTYAGTYDGSNSSTTSVTTGVDLTEKGLLIIKGFNGGSCSSDQHYWQWFDSERDDYNEEIYSNGMNKSYDSQLAIDEVNSTGFVAGHWGNTNLLNVNFIAASFRAAPKFFDVVKYSGNGTPGKKIYHNLQDRPGVIFLKNLSSSSYNWYVYVDQAINVNLGLQNYLALNQNYLMTGGNKLNDVVPNANYFEVNGDDAVNGLGQDYIAYIFSSGNIGSGSPSKAISVQSYTGTGSQKAISTNFYGTPLGMVWIKAIKSANNSQSGWVCFTRATTDLSSNNGDDDGLFVNTGSCVYTEIGGANSFTWGSGGMIFDGDSAEVNQNGSEYLLMTFALNGVAQGGTIPTGEVIADADDTSKTLQLKDVSGDWSQASNVIRDETIDEYVPDAATLEFVSSIPAAATGTVTDWGNATWTVSENSDFSSPMTTTKAIVPDEEQRLASTERGDIVLDTGTEYYVKVAYSSTSPNADSLDSEDSHFKTGAGTIKPEEGDVTIESPSSVTWCEDMLVPSSLGGDGSATGIYIATDTTVGNYYRSVDGINWDTKTFSDRTYGYNSPTAPGNYMKCFNVWVNGGFGGGSASANSQVIFIINPEIAQSFGSGLANDGAIQSVSINNTGNEAYLAISGGSVSQYIYSSQNGATWTANTSTSSISNWDWLIYTGTKHIGKPYYAYGGAGGKSLWNVATGSESTSFDTIDGIDPGDKMYCATGNVAWSPTLNVGISPVRIVDSNSTFKSAILAVFDADGNPVKTATLPGASTNNTNTVVDCMWSSKLGKFLIVGFSDAGMAAGEPRFWSYDGSSDACQRLATPEGASGFGAISGNENGIVVLDYTTSYFFTNVNDYVDQVYFYDETTNDVVSENAIQARYGVKATDLSDAELKELSLARLTSQNIEGVTHYTKELNGYYRPVPKFGRLLKQRAKALVEDAVYSEGDIIVCEGQYYLVTGQFTAVGYINTDLGSGQLILLGQ